MESDKSDDLAKIYEKMSNSWNSIFDYLDINSLFQSEVVSKYFRNIIKSYYKSKNNEINEAKENTQKENIEEIVKLFKKNLLSQYFNLFVHINISDQKFCNEDKSSDNTLNSMEEKIQLEKKYNPKTESIFFKNKIQIRQISIQENKFLILYNNNKFSILDFDVSDISNKFNESFSYNFSNDIINNFIYCNNQKEKIIFFIKENSTELFYLYLNKKEKEVNKLNLKNEFDIFKEENLIIKNIFTFNEFLLFHTNKDEFILVPFTQLKITKENDDDKNSEENGIIYPKKLENNFGVIKHVYSNNSNLIILNNEDQIYSIPASDYKNYTNQIPKFKLFSEQKFPNFYTISGYNNYFILLEKEKVKPLEEWNNDEIYKWFEEMELDDYLNIIKFQKITGKDIVQGGKDYLIDFMGVEEDHLNKLNYEINTLKFESSKNFKLWGWGNNKNGQLGLMNNQTFVKTPTQINLPNLMSDDTIEKIYCDKTYSILLTKFGNVFITGNYSVKDQSNDNQKKNNNNQSNQGKKNKGKNKHHKDEHKEKGKKNDKNKEKNKDNEINDNNYVENRWINISQNICYSSYNLYKGAKNKNSSSDSYFKIKDIFCHEDNIFFIGFYSNSIPFYAIQRKPKFKHLKKGGKFITSDKVIEHIQEFSKDKLSTFKIIYGDSLLKMLETTLDAYLESEVPFHKIIQIKDNNEVIWDRKKRYFKEDFINININK
jgi:uncharacterized protein (UPF0248 family)